MLNRTVFHGRMVADPELKHTTSDIAVLSFRVAWSKKYKEKETKCFLSCTAWRNNAEFIAKYFTKGQEIIVEGELNTREWEGNDGQKHSVIELAVEQAHFCGSKRDGQGGNSAFDQFKANAAEAGIPLNEGVPIPTDDDLPF